MAGKSSLGSTKRFGPRYGRRNKERVAKLEKGHRKRQKCPYCSYIKVKRLSRGIWQCDKCNAKFASKAYSIETPKRKAKPVAEFTAAPEPEETEELEVLEEDQEEAEVA